MPNVVCFRRRVGEALVISYPGGSAEVRVVGVDGPTGQATISVICLPSVVVSRYELHGKVGTERNNEAGK